ncbi:hypothetical protein D0B54_01820 [Solimonas sp. K1W22B-7]|uniref:hypothetical protein n=1 Tax=Solimonas sp. K1W22B-7 TaxID=2303331 RepID=UPI000E32FC15|nr:hypothetical protein [Solimonas sp. K1W22B-7]AXQ27494.1 hypothetical protein D0B54_01820 [Solimonas sp. K1W22B-7]
MRSWGIYCLVFGIGAFILPMMGMQFSILALFGEALPFVAGALIVLGVVLTALSFKQPQQA